MNKAAAECVRFVSEVATKFMCFVSKAAANVVRFVRNAVA
jgi:hypothetical protein